MTEELEEAVSCGAGASALRRALDQAGADDVDDLMPLDAEAREVLPVYGLAVDAVLCAVPGADGVSSRFLSTLDVADDPEVHEALRPRAPAPPPAPVTVTPPHRFRVIAKLAEDGRIEFGVELPNREQVIPTVRFLAEDAPADQWRVSSDVLIDDSPIGKIRTRRLADGARREWASSPPPASQSPRTSATCRQTPQPASGSAAARSRCPPHPP